ncbi:hypothetical protein EJ07DRAFT_157163 [Lizonia empirigonia]|nr:hypothetical protein EJ07DRAFT_157163 [Lizonia empirigonia]
MLGLARMQHRSRRQQGEIAVLPMPPSLEADKEEEETMEGEEGFLYLEGCAQPRSDHTLTCTSGLSWSPIACAQGNGDVEVGRRTIPDSASCFWLLSRPRAAVPTLRWYTPIRITVLRLYYLEIYYIPEYTPMFPSRGQHHTDMASPAESIRLQVQLRRANEHYQAIDSRVRACPSRDHWQYQPLARLSREFCPRREFPHGAQFTGPEEARLLTPRDEPSRSEIEMLQMQYIFLRNTPGAVPPYNGPCKKPQRLAKLARK